MSDQQKHPGTMKVLLTGGGTGGHVYPTLALLEILRSRFPVGDVLYVGISGRAEERIVPAHGLPIRYIDSAPWSGLQPAAMARALIRIGRGILQSIPILLKFRPHLILAAGGYVSAPITLASFLLRPFVRSRLVVDEQNLYPGLMNRIASLFAHAVLVSFPETPYYIWNQRCVYTGYPVRDVFTATADRGAIRARLGVPPDALMLLAYGGSMGSRSINRLIVESLPELARCGRRIVLVHAAGLASGEYNAWEDTRALAQARGGIALTPVPGTDGLAGHSSDGLLEYRLTPYLHQIVDYLHAADLVVSRAGAGTLAELAALGKPAVVIPKRGLPGDHQELNAISLAERGGCEVCFERPGPDGVDYVVHREFLDLLLALVADPDRLARLGEQAGRFFIRDFREKICDTVGRLIEGREVDYMLEFDLPKGLKIQKQIDALTAFLRTEPPGSLYRRYYGIQVESDLKSPDWQIVNRGIKLCGALQRNDKVSDLYGFFESGNGFIRRNALTAIREMDVDYGMIVNLVRRGLDDPYFEVRAGAAAMAGQHFDQLAGHADVLARLRALAARRFEVSEVQAAVIQVLPLFFPLDDYFTMVDRFRFARNVRLRQAVLSGIQGALSAGRIRREDMDRLRQFVKEILITTSSFKPEFSIRESYRELYDKLS